MQNCLDIDYLTDVREEVSTTYTAAEMSGFASFDDFFADVDVTNAFEEDWSKRKGTLKTYYEAVYSEHNKREQALKINQIQGT